jgi:hypothetical protein
MSSRDLLTFVILAILYERLVEVDRVDLLFSPYGFGNPAIDYAELKQVPIINIGLFE